ncbi:hypothetical protein AB0K12_45680 [Nonomuraea sp. NPDC049419]|uniref:hypothetical protein n=1 Tax=Nonomuraea sp. NPDC049419 TaxID=3155772 RepID=UPI00342A7DE3
MAGGFGAHQGLHETRGGSLDPGQQVLEVGRGEFSSEGPGGLVVAALEGDQPVFDPVKAGDVFSTDGGTAWETNWTADFRRTS